MKDSDIVEVMAQSAYEAEAPHTAYMVGLSWTAFCKVHPNRAESFRINARASLAALRVHGMEVVPVEPTEAMLIAAFNAAVENLAEANTECKTDQERSAKAIRPLWRAMITAANPTAGK